MTCKRTAVIDALISERLDRTPLPGVPARQIWRALSDKGLTPTEFGATIRELVADGTFTITIQYAVAGRKSMAENLLNLEHVPASFDFTDWRFVDTHGRQTFTPLVYLSADPLPGKVTRLMELVES